MKLRLAAAVAILSLSAGGPEFNLTFGNRQVDTPFWLGHG